MRGPVGTRALEGLPSSSKLGVWGVGRGRLCLVNGLNTFNCVLSSVQPLLVPNTPFIQSLTNPYPKAPRRDLSSFLLGDAVTLQEAKKVDRRLVARYRESGWDPGGAVDPRRGSSWNLISWEWGLGWWEVLRTGSLLTSPRKTPNTFPLSACSVPRIEWPLTSAHSLTRHFPHVWEPQCKKDVYGFQLTAVPTVAMGEALARVAGPDSSPLS